MFYDPVWTGHIKTLIHNLKQNIRTHPRTSQQPYPAVTEAYQQLQRTVQDTPWITGFFLQSALQVNTTVAETFKQ